MLEMVIWTFRWPYKREGLRSRRLGRLGSLEMHGFSGLEGVSGVIRRNEHFGGPIEEKVSDLGSLEGLEGLEMQGWNGCQVLSSG
mgnify:CR=1 FL=1